MINETELMTKVAVKIAEDSIAGAWANIKRFFKDMTAIDEIRYGSAYEEYLKSSRNKYSKIKTLIYRHSPRDIYSFYQCIGLGYNGKYINTSCISNLFDECSKIIITGTGGIGKSMLLKHLFLNAMETTKLIPVLIELRTFNTYDIKDISLKKAIYNALKEFGFTLEEKYFEYSINEGGYIILLDGFDEVSRDKTHILTKQIREFCDKYSENKFIISSRPSDEFIGWNDFAEMHSLKLTKKEALSLIKKIEFDVSVKEAFSKELEYNLYEKYESFASNPLLLTIMLLTFSDNASMPDNLNDFYELAFSTLFNMHDATKDIFVRDVRSGLSCEDFKLVFSYICFKSYFKNEYDFTEYSIRNYIQEAKIKFDNISFSIDNYLEDLTSSVCMLIKDGLKYAFSHRSFQEYFAACYTCKLTDDIQKRLLTNWLRESSSARFDLYLPMLFNIQRDKVNKVILFPGLQKLEQLYNKHGFTLDFWNNVFSQKISISKNKNGDFAFDIYVKDNYLCNVLSLTCKLNNFSCSKEYYDTEHKFALTLSENFEDLHMIPLKSIVDQYGEDSFIGALKWVELQVLFSINILKKYENSKISGRRKVISIIDEL